MRKLRFGILGSAKIGREKVIPPMMKGERTEVTAIASRDGARAREVADRLGIEKAYGSYEDLLADGEVDAIYNPLPNHMHVPWTIRAAEAGKHVLCEKPVALTRAGAEPLVAAAEANNVLIQEAFMVLTHPQWIEAKRIVASGEIGELRAIQGTFSYFNDDPDNIRNMAGIGGGGMLDIGCYPTVTSRFVTGREPQRVFAFMDMDPTFGTDRLGSVILRFGEEDGFPVQASFMYSTQLTPCQRMGFFGTKGLLEVDIPFNALPDEPMVLWLDDGGKAPSSNRRRIEIAACDQYGVAGDAFAAAVLDGTPQPVPLPFTLANMAVMDAAFRSAETGEWQKP
ncbi:MAG: Gfo/Idh/MocA family oxidoreductase [Geminicoccaceae bacterium]|nr:Gfo/Idh/MocA family oxidoreductase [Geminicoccaceae bacterium]